MTKLSPLPIAASALRLIHLPQGSLIMAGVQVVPPQHLPLVGQLHGPYIILQQNWFDWWGQWNP